MLALRAGSGGDGGGGARGDGGGGARGDGGGAGGGEAVRVASASLSDALTELCTVLLEMGDAAAAVPMLRLQLRLTVEVHGADGEEACAHDLAIELRAIAGVVPRHEDAAAPFDEEMLPAEGAARILQVDGAIG